jgi:hypothetical protein
MTNRLADQQTTRMIQVTELGNVSVSFMLIRLDLGDDEGAPFLILPVRIQWTSYLEIKTPLRQQRSPAREFL